MLVLFSLTSKKFSVHRIGQLAFCFIGIFEPFVLIKFKIFKLLWRMQSCEDYKHLGSKTKKKDSGIPKSKKSYLY